MPWTNLTPEQKKQVAQVMMGPAKKNNENLNRAMEALSSDPRLAEKMIKEAGLAEEAGYTSDGQDAEGPVDETSIEDKLTAPEGDQVSQDQVDPEQAGTGDPSIAAIPDDVLMQELMRRQAAKQAPQMPGIRRPDAGPQ